MKKVIVAGNQDRIPVPKTDRNIEITVMAALIVSSGMLDDIKAIAAFSPRSNYNPAFSGRNIRKISNLKYSKMPRSSLYQRKTF